MSILLRSEFKKINGFHYSKENIKEVKIMVHNWDTKNKVCFVVIDMNPDTHIYLEENIVKLQISCN